MKSIKWCWLFHKWSRWFDCDLQVSWAWNHTKHTVIGQRRICARCGKKEIREV